MAVRLTIVIVQATQRDLRMSDLEEDLLTRVMLETSLDAVFVGSFEQMEQESTDAICLSKIPAGSVIVSWLPAEAIDQHCQRLGLPWRLSQQPQTTQLRHKRLDSSSSTETVIRELQEMLKNVSLQTVQISLGSISKSNSPKPVIVPSANAEITIRPDHPERAQQPAQEFDELDQLVQDLEAMDL